MGFFSATEEDLDDCPISVKYPEGNTSYFFSCNVIQRNGTAVLENVSPEGSELPGCLGRLQNPGRHHHITASTVSA